MEEIFSYVSQFLQFHTGGCPVMMLIFRFSFFEDSVLDFS